MQNALFENRSDYKIISTKYTYYLKNESFYILNQAYAPQMLITRILAGQWETLIKWKFLFVCSCFQQTKKIHKYVITAEDLVKCIIILSTLGDCESHPIDKVLEELFENINSARIYL